MSESIDNQVARGPGADVESYEDAASALRDLLTDPDPTGTPRYDEATYPPRFEGDTSQMPPDACWALQHLITSSFIDSDNRTIWASLTRYEALLRSRLAELGLLLHIDRDRECAFTRQTDDPSPRARKLLHKRSLGLLDSILLVFCYQQYMAAPHDAFVTKADLLDHAMLFRPTGDNDEGKTRIRIDPAIETVARLGVLREIGGSGRYAIHRVVTSLLDAQQLDELTARYRAVSSDAGTAFLPEDEQDDDE